VTAGADDSSVTRKAVSRKEAAKAVNDVEGYLLWQAEVTAAAAQAEAFADRLPWLTTVQREDVVRVYTDDRLELSRAVLQRVADRALTLRQEYTERYRVLRMRVLGVFLTAVAGTAGVLVALDRTG
jgi:hypothetical protein